jgi:hypothetical protein
MPLYQRDNIPLEKFIQLIPDLVYIQEFPSKKSLSSIENLQIFSGIKRGFDSK